MFNVALFHLHPHLKADSVTWSETYIGDKFLHNLRILCILVQPFQTGVSIILECFELNFQLTLDQQSVDSINFWVVHSTADPAFGGLPCCAKGGRYHAATSMPRRS